MAGNGFSRLFSVTLLIVPWVSPAAGAELSPHPPTFSQVLVFGDSTVATVVASEPCPISAEERILMTYGLRPLQPGPENRPPN
jgi:hypothetical protein